MSEVELYKIPESWVETTIAEIIKDSQIGIVRSRALQNQDGIGTAYLKMNNVTWNGRVTNDNLAYVDVTDEELERYKIEEGDILFNTRNSSELVGKTAIANRSVEGFVYNNNLMRIRVNEGIEAKYIAYQMISPKFRRDMEKVKRATTNIAAVYAKDLLPLPLALAPLEQQKRIVAKIEELFSHIDAGIAALNKAKKLLKKYRQSVLKAAVTGDLTKQWREENKGKLEPASQLLERILQERRQKWEAQQLEQFKAKGKVPKDDRWKEKYKKPDKPRFKHNPPETWVICSFEELILELKNGISKKPAEEKGLAILRISAVRPMAVHKDDVRFLPVDFKSDGFEIEDGDLLFTRYNGNPELVGVCGKVRGLKDKTVYPDKIMRARPVSTSMISTDYLELSLNCGISKDFIRSVTKTTAGQSGVAGGDLKKCPSVLPSYDEQVEIANIVADKFEVMQRLSMSIDAQLDKAERNKQSILASAFSGHLKGI